LKSKLEQQLVKVKTTADRDKILSEAKDAGVTVNQGFVDQANKAIVSGLRNQLVTAINKNSVTQADIDAYEKMAKTAGVTADPSLIKRATTAVESVATTKQTALNIEYRNQLINAIGTKGNISQSQLDTIVADAKAAGATIDPATLSRATAAAQKYEAAAPQRAAAEAAVKKAILNAGTVAEINNQVNTARADGVAIDPTVVEQATANIKAVELGKQFQPELAKATTQAQLDDIKSRAQAAGAKLETSYVDRVQQGITQAVKAAETATQAAKTAEAQADWQKQIQTAASTGNVDQVQSLIGQAKAAGQWNLNDATTNSYVTQAQGVVNQEQAQKTALAQAQYQQQAQQAQTPDEAKKIIEQAKSAGAWNLNQGVTDGYIRQAQTRADQQQQAQSDFATAQKTVSGLQNLTLDSKIKLTDLDQSMQQDPDLLRLTDNGRIPIQMTDSTAPGYLGVNQVAYYFRSGDAYAQQREKIYDYASKLAPPSQAGNQFTPGGAELIGVPDDPTTEANEAAWYAYIGGQMTKVGEDGKPSGGPISPKELQTIQQQIGQNTQLYQAQQRSAAEAAELAARQASTAEFEKTLPDPASLPEGAVRYGGEGPGGVRNEYYLTPTNLATGEPGRWTRFDGNMQGTDLITGQPTTAKVYDENRNLTIAQNEQVYAQQRAAQIAAAQAERDKTFFDTDFGKVFTVMVLAAAVGPMIGEALSGGATAADAAGAAAGMAEGGATASEIASALEASGMSAEAAATMAETATGITSGAIDVQALGAANGVTAEAVASAAGSADPLFAINETIAATTSSGAVAPLYELSIAETAELMRNVDPNLINSLASGTAGTAGGTATSIFAGQSINPLTNILTNIGVTNPILSGALTGAGTGAVINALTGKPITGQSLLTSALGGGVAGGIGSIMPDFGGGALGGAIGGAATNLGATAVVSLVTGQPITASSLAGAALIGGAIGGAVGAVTDGAGNTTYQYDDGSSMTVNRVGTPVAVTDNTGAQVPVGAVDRLTGEPKQLAPVEDRVGTPVNPNQQLVSDTGAIPTPTAPVDLTSTGMSDSAPGTIYNGPNGPEVVLDSGKTVLLSDYQAAIDSGKPISIDGQIDTQYRVDIGAPPRYSGMPDAGAPPEGYEVAKPSDVAGPEDTNNAQNPYKPGTYYDPETNTWFTPATPRPVTPVDTTGIDTGPTIPVNTIPTAPVPTTPVDYPLLPVTPGPLPDWYTNPTTPPVDTITQPVSTPRVPTETIDQLPVAPAPVDTPPVDTITQPVSTPRVPTETIDQLPVAPAPVDTTPVVTQPVDTTPGPISPGTGTGTGTGGTGTGTGTGTGGTGTGTGTGTGGTGTGTGTGGTAPPVEPPLSPLEPIEIPPTSPIPEVVVEPPPAVVEPPPAVVQPPAVVEPPYVPPTYPPIYVPPIEPPKVEIPGYGPLDPIQWGNVGTVNLPGTNPGFFTNVPRQYEPQGVRSQYYYGQHPYQTGERFSPEQYRQVNAPVAPWGLQQMYNPQTQTIENLLRGVGLAAGQAPYNRPGAPKV
jgi:hypothetical protein